MKQHKFIMRYLLEERGLRNNIFKIEGLTLDILLKVSLGIY